MTNGVTSTAATGGQAPNGNIEKRLAALEAVLPTLATKADLADLRAEMRVQNEQLRAEMRVQNELLRTEMRVQNEQLRTEMQRQYEQLRTETERMMAGLYKWLLATTLTMIIAFGVFFFSLANLLMSRIPGPNSTRTSTSIEAVAAPAINTARLMQKAP
jgi:hypothetical protein